MSFVQKHRKNATLCDGCENRCEIVVHPVETDKSGETKYTIDIAGQQITDFQNKEGDIVLVQCKTRFMSYALAYACKVASMCDNYKTR